MRRTMFTGFGWTAFIFAVYMFLGFRPAPPQTIAAGETCFQCRKTIVDHKLAAEIMDRNMPTKYRTPGCLAAYVAEHPSDVSRYFVTDYVTGGLIEAEHAYYVRVLINDRTGERDYRAYHNRVAAEAAAYDTGEKMVRWDTVLDRAKARAGV